MNPSLLAGPAVEPISLADMKAYLRVDGSDEDELVSALITAGRVTVERQTRLLLIEQTWRMTLPAWPLGRQVSLPLHPVTAIAAVRVPAADGPHILLAAASYRLEATSDPARLVVEPEAPEPRGGAIEIDLVCGFGEGPGSVPAPLLLSIQRLVAHWFEHRGDEARRGVPSVPADALDLIASFRRPRLA